VDGDPVVAAAGDIACAPPATGTASGCHHRDTSDLLVAGGYDAVLPLGDVQYECGQASAYRSVYDPTWGRVKAVTRPAVGDNEYTGNGCSTAGASGYFGYFGPAATPRQPSCRSACAGYYSYDAGHEHLYERFAPQTPSGVADPNGLRQFIVGTGGKSRHGLSGTPPRNSQARYAGGFGVLALTLHSTSYDWRFVSEAGRTFTDAGSHPCH
jgi:hypothetical protein